MWYSGICGVLDPFLCVDGMSKKKRTEWKNRIELQNHFSRWLNIALDRFRYEGLPDTVDTRMLELSFILRGAAMIAEVEGGLFSLMCAPGGNYNIYGVPTKAWGYGMNGFNREFPLYIRGADESNVVRIGVGGGMETRNYGAVMGFDNKARYPLVNYLVTGCQRLADIKRSEDVVRANMKRPAIVACEESQINSVRAAFKNRDDNEDVVVISSAGLSLDSVHVWDLKTTPGILTEFADAYEREENIMREIMGLNSLPNQDKRERLITDEANANNEAQEANIEVYLEMRRMFIEDVNAAFGTNATVELTVKPETETEVEYDDELDGVSGMEEDAGRD